MGKCRPCVKVFIQSIGFCQFEVAGQGARNKNSSGKIAPPGHKIYAPNFGKRGLQLLQRFGDFTQVLMRQRFVRLYVVGTPAEMRSGTQALACTGAACDARSINFCQQTGFCQWQ